MIKKIISIYRALTYPIFLVVVVLIMLLFIRLTLPIEIDDISPQIPCEKYLISNSDTLYIIPLYNNISIAENTEWCNYIISLNKTLAMHGVYHTYEEFKDTKDLEYINKGINEFTKCFGNPPQIFKPPQLKISKDNIKLIKSLGLEVRTRKDQIMHKVYHCQDSGGFKNKYNDLF